MGLIRNRGGSGGQTGGNTASPLGIGFVDGNGNSSQAAGITNLYLRGTGQDQGGGDWSFTPEPGNLPAVQLQLNLINGRPTILVPASGLNRGFFVPASEISMSAGATIDVRFASGSDGPFFLVIEKAPLDTVDILFPDVEFIGFKPDFSQPGKIFGMRGMVYNGNKVTLAADQTDPAPFAGGNTSIDPLTTNPLAWFDATAENTLFSDTAGTTASTNGNPVRRWLDLSPAGNHLTVEIGTPNKTARGVEFGVGGASGMQLDSDISLAQNVYAVLNHNKGGAQFSTLLSAGLNSDRYNVRTDNSNWRSNPNNNANSDDWTGTYRINDIAQTSWKENQRYLFSAKKGNPKASPNYFRSVGSPSFAGRHFRGRIHELIICGPVTAEEDEGLKQYLANRWNLNI